MKEFDYTKVKHYKLYNFIKVIFRPLVKAVFKMEFKGLENIPKDRSNYIVAINHTSAFDPILVACPKELPPLHFMAKVELFKNPLAAWFITHMYGFPVRRGKGDTSAIDYGIKLIKENHIMAICPEGRRIKDKDGVPQRAKSGVAVIAKATGADILPVAIYCNGKIKAGRKVVISYGKMIKNEELGMNGENSSPSEIKHAANMVMDNIVSLWEAEKQID